MTTDSIEKLRKSNGLLDAFRLIVSDSSIPDGALKINAPGGVKAAVCFGKGRITGAYLHSTGERGNEALAKIIQLQGVRVKYAPFDPSLIAPNERLEIEIAALVHKFSLIDQTPTADDSATADIDIRALRQELAQEMAQREEAPGGATPSSVAEPETARTDEEAVLSVAPAFEVPASESISAPPASEPIASEPVPAPPASEPVASVPVSAPPASEPHASVPVSEPPANEPHASEPVSAPPASESIASAPVSESSVVQSSTSEPMPEPISAQVTEAPPSADVVPQHIEPSAELAPESQTMDFEVAGASENHATAEYQTEGSETFEVPVEAATESFPSPPAEFDALPGPDYNEIPSKEMPIMKFSASGALQFIEEMPQPITPIFDEEEPHEKTHGFPTDAIAQVPADAAMQTTAGDYMTMDVPSAEALKKAAGDDDDHDYTLDEETINKRIRDLSAGDDREDFHKVEGILDESTEMLSEEQRELLEALTRNLRDEETFQEADPLLHVEDDIAERQHELLQQAQFDDKAFDYVEKHLETDIPSLTEEQRDLLKTLASEASDKETFEELDEFLQQQGVHLTVDQLWEFGELLSTRTREEQVEEFRAQDERLKIPDDEEFYDFQEHEDDEEYDSEELDAIEGANVIDADRRFRKHAEEEKRRTRRGVQGIIGRVRENINDRIAYYEATRDYRPEFPIGKVIGGVTLTLLLLGLFTIPGMIRASATGKTTEQLAQEQMRLAVDDEIGLDVPDSAHEDSNPTVASGPQIAPGSTGGGGDDTPSSAIENDDMAFAHKLIAEGKLELAAEYMENYIAKNPDNIQARISLVQCYIAAGHRDRARLLCIQTLKRKVTSGERQTLYSLWHQCLTN